MSSGSSLSFSDTSDAFRPAVLFLHGFLGCADDWQQVISGLQNDCRCVAVDLPGHGDSTTVDDSCYPMSGSASAILALLDNLDIPRCQLVGYSMGGRLGLYLVTHHPDRFERAILESASPGLADPAEREVRRIHDEALAKRLATIPVEQFVDEWYQQPLFETTRNDSGRFDELRRRRAHNDPAGLAKSLRLMGTGTQPSLWSYLPAITIPMLYLAGDLDKKFSFIATQMASQTPKSRAEIFSQGGHALHFEQPDIYISRIRAFLTR